MNDARCRWTGDTDHGRPDLCICSESPLGHGLASHRHCPCGGVQGGKKPFGRGEAGGEFGTFLAYISMVLFLQWNIFWPWGTVGGPYLIQVYGLSKTAAGSVLSMFAVALMVGSPFLSWIANHIGRKPVFISCSLLLIAVCGLFYSFTEGLTLPMLYLLFFCLFLSGGTTGPVVAAVSKELFPVAIAGTSVGMVNLFPFFWGGALSSCHRGHRD